MNIFCNIRIYTCIEAAGSERRKAVCHGVHPFMKSFFLVSACTLIDGKSDSWSKQGSKMRYGSTTLILTKSHSGR